MYLQTSIISGMDYIPTQLDWKCNGCGHRMSKPDECPECGTSRCPKCKRTNSLMNDREYKRMVNSDRYMLPKNPRSKKTKKAKDSKPKLPTKLAEELGITLPK